MSESLYLGYVYKPDLELGGWPVLYSNGWDSNDHFLLEGKEEI